MNWGNWKSNKIIPPFGSAGSSVIPAGTGLQTNLTAFWQFQNTSWLDSTGNGSTLTATGSPTIGTGPGGLNTCVSFSGGTMALSCASNSFLVSNNGSISISGWINTNGNFIDGWLSKSNFAFQQTEWQFEHVFTSNNFYQCGANNSGGSEIVVISTTPVDTSNNWMHIVFTYDVGSTALKIYVNGSLVTNPSGPNPILSTSLAPFNIWRDDNNSGNPLAQSGSVAFVGFWQGRVLSAGDVSLLYNSGNGRTYAQMA